MNKREQQAAKQRVKASLMTFTTAALIDTDDGPKRAARCHDLWQRENFEAMDSACRWTARQSNEEPEFTRFAYERGRGHSKSSDCAMCATYLLYASEHKIDGVAVAADKDQAGLIRDAVDRLLRFNPWLAADLEVQTWKVVHKRTGSTLTIISADLASSWGINVQFIIMDEVSHWPKRAIFDSMLSAAAKRKRCLVLAIFNAGFKDHWFWEVRELLRVDPAWYFHRLDGPVASWISQKLLDEQRRLLLPEEFQRLWENQWSSNSGATLKHEDIVACTTLPGPSGPKDDRCYFAGLDLGIFRDHSALVVLGAHPDRGKVEVASVMSWNPADYEDHKVDLMEVAHAVRQMYQYYGFVGCKYDFWQAEHMAQELMSEGVPMSECKMQQEDTTILVRALLDGFSSQRIAMYPHKDLERDLLRIRIKESLRGYKLESVRDEAGGHADRAVALALALPAAMAFVRSYNPNLITRDEVLVA